MQAEEFKQYTEKCFHGAEPQCICACPLKVDIRAFIDKVQKGNFTAAYRFFRNQVLFPRIVSSVCSQPCGNACIGNQDAASIQMRYLERSSIMFTKDRTPMRYNVPEKDARIAIIGGGLSGMACALKLAGRRYKVTVYEKQDYLGGRLAELMDKDVYLQEFQDEFADSPYTLKLSTAISDLDDLQADAVFIATGAGGPDFGLLEGIDCNSLGTKKQGVFLGGNILGTTPVESIEHGVRVSHSIEKYLKTGLMDGVPQTYEKRAINQNFYMPPLPKAILPENGNGEVSQELAVAEAKRCFKCDCFRCMDACDLMRNFNKNPHRIVSDIIGTMHTIDGMTKRVASRLVNSCSQCGLCTTICPEHIDMEDCLLQARRFLFKEGALPAAYHDYWLRDMAFANSDAACGLIMPENLEKAKYLFFPGCQLGASNPEYVLNAYNYLKKACESTAVFLGCCGIPADWAGDEALRNEVHYNILKQWSAAGEPVIIGACPTCLKTFGRYLPQMKIVSLYEIMEKNALPEWKDLGEGKVVSVFDPCASRYDPVMQKSIRQLLANAGYTLEELNFHGEEARCCSFGGQIHAANPGQVKKITTIRINENDNPYIAYCANCRDTFVSAEKKCSHILDIFFDKKLFDRPAPDLSRRRRNRVWLKQSLVGGAPAKEEIDTVVESINVNIPHDLQKKMNENMILREEVVSVIEHCKITGNMLKNNKTGEYVGHLAQGTSTIWVVFTEDASGYTLKNIYSHRLMIQEG